MLLLLLPCCYSCCPVVTAATLIGISGPFVCRSCSSLASVMICRASERNFGIQCNTTYPPPPNSSLVFTKYGTPHSPPLGPILIFNTGLYSHAPARLPKPGHSTCLFSFTVVSLAVVVSLASVTVVIALVTILVWYPFCCQKENLGSWSRDNGCGKKQYVTWNGRIHYSSYLPTEYYNSRVLNLAPASLELVDPTPYGSFSNDNERLPNRNMAKGIKVKGTFTAIDETFTESKLDHRWRTTGAPAWEMWMDGNFFFSFGLRVKYYMCR